MVVFGSICDIPFNGYLLVIFVLLVSRWFLTRISSRNQPPGPVSLPIVGCLFSLPHKDPRKALRTLAARYGEVMQVDMGQNRLVILNSYAVIRDTILKQGHLYWKRPKSMMHDFHYEQGIGRQNRTWSEQRRFALHNLRDLGFGKNRMELIIADEVENLIDELKKLVNRPFNPIGICGKVSANVMLRLAFGKQFSYDDPKLANHIRLFEDLFTMLEKRNFSSSLPYVRHIYHQKLKAAFMKVYHTCLKWVDEKKSLQNKEGATDFIDSYLKEIALNGKRNSSFTEEMLAWNLVDLYGAGSDTTGVTLTFGIYYMILHPEIQRKVHDEIHCVVGSHRRPVLGDRANLPYTEAVISEIQRKGDIVPFAVPHSNTADTTIRGYFIPEGSHIVLNLHNVHRDPTTWADPEKFDPGRFLDENGNYVKRNELIPFGVGKRSCLGESLARAELFLIFAGLIQQFDFQKVEGGCLPETEGTMGLVVHPKSAEIVIRIRNTQ